MKIQEFWDHLTPNVKRGLAISAAIGAVLGLAWLSMGVEPPKLTLEEKSEKIHRLLTDTDPRSLTLDALAMRVKDLEAKDKEIGQKLDQIVSEIKQLRESDEAKFKTWTASQRAEYEKTLEDLRSKLEQAQQGAPTDQTGPKPAELPPNPTPPAPPKIRPWSPDGDREEGPSAVRPPSPQPQAASGPPGAVIRVVAAESSPPTPSAGQVRKEPPLMQLPAGSILSGVLLNGLDAPTSRRARQDPQPVLVRIKREAILPNRYRSDIRECFLIASGYGDLSAERAYLRSETLSCIRNDRKVLEAKLRSYAVGEDGKVGVRGRLVSKQGQVLANALLAGFAKGISQIFGRQQVPVIVTSPQGTAPFQSLLSADAAQAAAVRGVGESLETLARFYLDMAQNLFPVIEVDAGRKIEFVVNEGFRL